MKKIAILIGVTIVMVGCLSYRLTKMEASREMPQMGEEIKYNSISKELV